MESLWDVEEEERHHDEDMGDLLFLGRMKMKVFVYFEI